MTFINPFSQTEVNAILLVVDDRPDNLFMIQQLIAGYLPKCGVLTTTSAQEGMKLVVEHHLDGMIIDVQMPEINGIEMCQQLKARPTDRPPNHA